jgi:hypothetical protein
MSARFPALLRWYLAVLMGGLFVQGIGSLLFRLAPALAASAPFLVRGIFGIDFWHAWIHILWGAAGSVVVAAGRWPASVRLALGFGVFYTALGIAGVAIHHPLGLELDWFENSFHLVAGPATLVLGALAASLLRGARVPATPR